MRTNQTRTAIVAAMDVATECTRGEIRTHARDHDKSTGNGHPRRGSAEGRRAMRKRLVAAVAAVVVLSVFPLAGAAWAPRDCGNCGPLEKIAERLHKVNEELAEVQDGWVDPSEPHRPEVRALLSRIVSESEETQAGTEELLATLVER